MPSASGIDNLTRAGARLPAVVIAYVIAVFDVEFRRYLRVIVRHLSFVLPINPTICVVQSPSCNDETRFAESFQVGQHATGRILLIQSRPLVV